MSPKLLGDILFVMLLVFIAMILIKIGLIWFT